MGRRSELHWLVYQPTCELCDRRREHSDFLEMCAGPQDIQNSWHGSPSQRTTLTKTDAYGQCNSDRKMQLKCDIE